MNWLRQKIMQKGEWIFLTSKHRVSIFQINIYVFVRQSSFQTSSSYKQKHKQVLGGVNIPSQYFFISTYSNWFHFFILTFKSFIFGQIYI